MAKKDRAAPSTPNWIPNRWMAWKICLAYAALGGIWIFSSGWLLHFLVKDQGQIAFLENVKGWFYVAVTAALLWYALDRYFMQIRRSARMLQESERRWYFALEGAGHGVWDWNVKTNEVFYSPLWKAMLGFEPNEIGNSYSDWEDLVHPEDLPRVLAELQHFLTGGAPLYINEHRVRCKDGSYKWILDQGKIISRDADGKPLRILGTHFDMSELKRADQSLRESESKWRSYVEDAPVGVVVADAEGSIAEANRSAEMILGYEQGGLLKARLADLPVSGMAMSVSEYFSEVVRKGQADGQFLLRKKDRSLVWTSMRASRISRDRFMAIFQDITAHKNAQEALERSEAEFRAMFEIASIGMAQADPDTGRWLRVNQKMCDMTGYSDFELRQKRILDLTHPEDRQKDWDMFSRVVSGELPAYRLEKRYVRKDGSIAWVSVNMTILRDASGRALRSMATIEDITERKQSESKLRESEKRFRETLESMMEGCQIIGFDWRYRYLNPAAARQGRSSVDELLGATVIDAYPGIESTAMFRAWERCLLAREPQQFESEFVFPDGAKSWFRYACQPVSDGIFILTLDITEEKRLEERLRQAQKLEAIGQLAGGVAHDFNNILAAIMMNLGLLQMTPNLDPETEYALKDLETHALRASALTRQLLMFSRRSVLAVKPLNLNEVITNLLRMLSRLIGEHIDLEFKEAPGLPLVSADTGLLEQVIMNLVVNARDAMSKGGLLTIQTRVAEFSAAGNDTFSERRSGRHVCLEVSDTGHGMNSETLKHIFEPFFTTKDAGRGTGLGLATVHGIVAQHTGWVEVDSREGYGSTFRVFLPTTQLPASEVVEDRKEDVVHRGMETILLVEDEPSLRRLASRSLRNLGYNIFEAANGNEALALWEQHNAAIDLIFTDMVMPEGMTGLELTERLRAEKPGVKAIITSGYSVEMATAGVPTEMGIVYLSKPYQLKSLAAMVRDCLDRN